MKELYQAYVEEGLSTRQIANNLNCSQSTVKYWLKRFNLKTKLNKFNAGCLTHHQVNCTICKSRSAWHVSQRRKKIKALLVEEHGGKCIHCDYNRSLRSLHFHHRDPREKLRCLGNWSQSLDAARKEAAKCDLVCSNCHGEIEEALYSEADITQTS